MRSGPWRHSLWWLPIVAYMGAIFYVSSLPNPLPGLTQAAGDKTLHAIAYALLALLCGRAIADEGAGRRVTLLLAFVIASTYGATDEWHQWFVPGRGADVYDWGADSIGAAVGAIIHAATVPVWPVNRLSTPAQS